VPALPGGVHGPSPCRGALVTAAASGSSVSLRSWASHPTTRTRVKLLGSCFKTSHSLGFQHASRVGAPSPVPPSRPCSPVGRQRPPASTAAAVAALPSVRARARSPPAYKSRPQLPPQPGTVPPGRLARRGPTRAWARPKCTAPRRRVPPRTGFG